jgi:hypothetical protein
MKPDDTELPPLVVNGHNRRTYYKVKELPRHEYSDPEEPGCTRCVAIHDNDLCNAFPSCGHTGNGFIYIKPWELEEYKVAYTIARVSS